MNGDAVGAADSYAQLGALFAGSRSPLDLLTKAHDASHYLLVPELVVAPEGAEDVAALLAACSDLGVPLTFRGGGTSLSGQGGTQHVLADTRRHFREVTVLDEGKRVRVQPGATVRQVNAHLSPYGTKLGPDPASEGACTIGGVVANNSSGMACGTEFNTYRTLESAVLVLANGQAVDTSARDADRQLQAIAPDLHAGLLRLQQRIRDDRQSVATIERQFRLKNTMGYGLNAFLDFEVPVDVLLHLVIGSEGTLAWIAEATFRTVSVRPHAATGLLVFENLFEATSALPALVGTGLATIELMDATSLRVCQTDPRADDELRSLEVKAHAAFLVEFQEHGVELLAERTADAATVLGSMQMSVPAALTQDPASRSSLWHLRKGLYATVAGSRPTGTTALLEDVAVPVPALAATCDSLTELFALHGYRESVIFGHAKDGNVHFMLNESFEDPRSIERYLNFTEQMVELVLGHGGTLKAEHGTGRIMAPFLERQYGQELYDVMVQLKALFDPRGILNPGVIINNDSRAHIKHLKTTPQVEIEVDRCVECGFCEPVCPSKDLTMTPRDRIVARREMRRAELAGDHDLATELRAAYEYDGLQTCAADGMCQTACPVLIDTGSLVRRLRREEHGAAAEHAWNLAATHWSPATRAASVGLSAAHALPEAVPRRGSGLLRRALGVEQVPLWTGDLPRGGSPRKRLRTRAATDQLHAVFLPSCTGSMFGSDETIGASEAFLRLCKRAGLNVAVPDRVDDLCCTAPWKSKGMARGRRSMEERVIASLTTATHGGAVPVVCDASSCTEGLSETLGKGSGLVLLDALTFVMDAVLPSLPIINPVGSVVVHPTCSTTRMGTSDVLVGIAQVCAAEVEVPVNWGCCAFAGDRGLLHPELTESATQREAEEVSHRRFDAYVSSNRTCELGMTRATGHKYRHVLELLELVSRSAE